MSSKAMLKRQHILKSATDFILENNFNALTLDAVAKQAGISKGGLLYHFQNKEALLTGLTKHIFAEFTKRFEEFAKEDSSVNGKWCRAFIEASKWDLENNGKLNIGIMSASILNENLSENLSQSYQYMQSKMEEDGTDAITATIIRLAIDGLYYSELFNIAPLEEKIRNEVFQQLLDITR